MKKIYLSCFVALFAYQVNAQFSFPSMDTMYTTKEVRVPASPIKLDVVYREGQNWVKKAGTSIISPTLQNHDYMKFLPENGSSTKGWLVINHEITNPNTHILGQGGAMSVVKVESIAGKWSVVNDPERKDTSFAVNFDAVGHTTTNCGGADLPTGNILTAEEIFGNFESNKVLSEKKYDTTDFTIPATYPEFGGKTISRYKNYGWMVEVDPKTAMAKHKNYHMGRFSHEGGAALRDKKTVYLTDDYYPGALLFKFVADVAGTYTAGDLFAYKQTPGAYSGGWVKVERNLDSLVNARTVALRKGATMFTRLEWIVEDTVTGNLYLTETGRDKYNIRPAKVLGGTLPKHWEDLKLTVGVSKDSVDDPYGRVLVLNPQDGEVKPLINGGISTKGFSLASPDGLAFAQIGTKRWLIVEEDLISITKGRVRPQDATGAIGYEIPESFLLDLDIANPTVEDLHLYCQGPRQSELTGACFTPDGNTIFINNQHPDISNDAPFEKSATIAISGFKNVLTNIPVIDQKAKEFVIYPNPVFQALHFNKILDATLYDAKGVEILSRKNTSTLDVLGLPKGSYIIKINDGVSSSSSSIVIE